MVSQRQDYDQPFVCSVRATLFELLGDEKYLGARPGVIAALHTWGGTLVLHPHVHCLVTGGGLNSGGQWRGVRNGFLLPSRVVMVVFRGKLLEAICRAVGRGDLKLPEGMRLQQFYNLLNKLGRKKWNVHIRERYPHGQGVLTYLARYLRGGPISNHRLVSCEDGTVTFLYRDHRDSEEGGLGRPKEMSLSIDQFLGRLLLHVPEGGTQVVRSSGLYAHTKSEELALCREQLGQGPVEQPVWVDWQTYCSGRGDEHPERCPVCGRRMVCVVSWSRGGVPPMEVGFEVAA